MNATSKKNSILMGLYTLTPTHCGTGQTRGAVDLPIAREAHTELPVIPATSMKGVARDRFPESERELLFGPDTDKAEGLKAGGLIFTEGKLIAFPVRSLNRPFFYVTCTLVLERLHRDLRAFGIESTLSQALDKLQMNGTVRVSQELPVKGQPLVIEDLVFESAQFDQSLQTLAKALAGLVPKAESATRERLQRSILLLPDEEYVALVKRTTPVQARTKLTSAKTTGTILNDQGRSETGNLWYEEALPADCLFALFVSERQPGRVADFQKHQAQLSPLQIGGNETVGQGLCWWTPWAGA